MARRSTAKRLRYRFADNNCTSPPVPLFSSACSTALIRQKRNDFFLKPIAFFRLALPNSQHAPASFSQRSPAAPIAGRIALQFRNPVGPPRGRNPARPATVHVPKAAANIDDFPQPRKHQIRRPRQAAHMQPIAKPQPMHKPPHGSADSLSHTGFNDVMVFARRTTTLGNRRTVTAHSLERTATPAIQTYPDAVGLISAFGA
jgi:hypothetical protein